MADIGTWCGASGFLDRKGACRNPDGCVCAAIAGVTGELATLRAENEQLRRERDAQRTRQEERVRVLEEALRPFADQASTFDSCGKEFVPDRFEPAIVDHTIGDLRRARAALGNGGGDA